MLHEEDFAENSSAAGTGSEAGASGPAPHAAGASSTAGDAPGGSGAETAGLTVDDILGAEQSAAAAAASADEAAGGAGEAAAADAPAAEGAEEDAESSDEANPLLEDLRRVTAEYANYRKRTEANAEIEKQRAKAAAVSPLLAVLDDLDRAEKHGDLAPGSAFATIAAKLRGALEKLGLTAFGEVGEQFDPQVHEAIAQVPAPGAAPGSVIDVVSRGYRIGEVELRPAQVAVAVE